MKALVTGSAGFVGRHLVRRLTSAGHDVTGIDIRAAESNGFWRAITADIRDEDQVAAALKIARPEVVFHLAAQTSVTVSMRDPLTDVQTNIVGTLNIGRQAALREVRRLVNVSSGGAMFGEPPSLPADDDSPVAPRSYYGASKVAAEQFLRVIEAGTGMSVASVRPANIYGPGQDSSGEAGVVAIFVSRMLSNEPVTVFAPGSDTRDYVFVGDVVDALILAAESPSAASCVVGTGIETSTLDLFRMIADLTGYQLPPQMGQPRVGDVRRSALNATRARALWGWTPSTRLEEGLRATVEAFSADQSRG